MKERLWNESTGEVLFCVIEGVKILLFKLGIDEYLFFVVVRGILYNRIFYKNLDGYIIEEKVKLGENLVIIFLGFLDFFIVVLFDLES